MVLTKVKEESRERVWDRIDGINRNYIFTTEEKQIFRHRFSLRDADQSRSKIKEQNDNAKIANIFLPQKITESTKKNKFLDTDFH